MMPQRIRSVALAECRLPIARPLRLGPVTIRTRDVVAVRLTAEDGSFGDALGYTRSTPLYDTLAAIAVDFLGVSPHERRSVVQAFTRARVNGRPTFVRAVSLLDIALHDLAAKALGVPLFRLLGGSRVRVPVSRVAGYYAHERSHDSICDEVAAHFDAGFRQTKIMIGGTNAPDDARLVEAAMRRATGRLGADAHWSWDCLTEAGRACRLLDGAGLAFIEDPFGPHRSSWLGTLQARLRTPLAAGEDVPEVSALAALSKDVQVLRVDATTCGGVAAACTAIEAAELNGCEIFPHVHTPLHLQLAAVYPSIGFVEEIGSDVGVDPLHCLLRRQVEVQDGEAKVSEEPGAGTELDWAAVARFAANATMIEP